MNLEDSDDLYTSQHGLEELIFECDLIVKRLLVTVAPPATTAHAAPESKGVRLYPGLRRPLLMGHHFGSNLMLPYTAEILCPM